MPKRSSRDINETTASIVAQSTGQRLPVTNVHIAKNPSAVALGKLGGLKGGKARAAALTAKRRQEIAKKAAKSRWKRKK